MSEPAYHLRPNKAVERALFIDLLQRIEPYLPEQLTNYRYVGMGGPYLDDFRMLQNAFPGMRMTSLETDGHTLARQKINQPHRAVELTRLSTGKFVRSFSPTQDRHLIWFDHSKASWAEQIEEACDLIGNLRCGSVFKITLIPKPKHLCPSTDIEDRHTALQEQFGASGPFEIADASEAKFPNTIFKIFKDAITDAVPDTQYKVVRSLASYLYADKSPVLTITMIVLRPADFVTLAEKSGLSTWEFADLDWVGPLKIEVPELSVRERISIDRWLPGCTPSGIVRRLKMKLAPTREETVKIVGNYAQFSRHMPHFMRVIY